MGRSRAEAADLAQVDAIAREMAGLCEGHDDGGISALLRVLTHILMDIPLQVRR